MNTKVYVGNLPYEVTEESLKAHFETQGKVSEVHVVIDKYTDQPRGFAFVTMEDNDSMPSQGGSKRAPVLVNARDLDEFIHSGMPMLNLLHVGGAMCGENLDQEAVDQLACHVENLVDCLRTIVATARRQIILQLHLTPSF